MQEQIKDLLGNDDTEAMYQAALNVPLEEKIKLAIMTIQNYEHLALKQSEDGFYVCFSGGKDSVVLAKLFEMSGVKYTLNYSNVTIDPPELVQFIKREYPQARWHRNVQGSLPGHMISSGYGPPTRFIRWCCDIFKEQGGNGLIKAVGVRASESARRKGLWTTLKYDTRTKLPMLCPILYWTEKDVWNFINLHNVKYCSLYDEVDENGEKMFKRLGCVGCPMASRKDRLKQFKRWPKYEQLWKRSLTKYYEQWKDVPTKTKGTQRVWAKLNANPDEFWSWWMEEDNVNDTDQPDCQLFLW